MVQHPTYEDDSICTRQKFVYILIYNEDLAESCSGNVHVYAGGFHQLIIAANMY